MFTVSPDGTLVDYMGFPLSTSELQEVLAACQKSINQSADERVELAQQHCKATYPTMFNQLNWGCFK